MILTSVEGQENLPRYFARVYRLAAEMHRGRVDFVLPDERVFRAEGRLPGPVATLNTVSYTHLTLPTICSV